MIIGKIFREIILPRGNKLKIIAPEGTDLRKKYTPKGKDLGNNFPRGKIFREIISPQ